MNVNTGDLYRHLGIVPEDERENVTPVPEQYKDEILEMLQGKDYVKVDMNKSTPLVNWAKKKKKKQMAKASQKRNRR